MSILFTILRYLRRFIPWINKNTNNISTAPESNTTPKESWWKRAGKLFSSKKKEESNDDQSLESGAPNGPSNPLGFHFGEVEGDQNIQAELTHRLEKLNDDFFEIGYQEGRNGKETTNERVKQIASFRVKYIREELSVVVQQILEGKKIARETIQEDCATRTRELESQQEFLDDLTKQSRFFSRDFSSALGYFYLIIGVLLVIADIPLAVELTKKGFGLETSNSYEITQLFSSKFLLVLSTNWEVFVMATGVALCTVYIKIFWDEFLASPIELAVRHKKDLRDNNIEEDWAEIKKTKKIRFRVKVGILIATVIMIGILGKFRADTMKREAELEVVEMKQAAEARGLPTEQFEKFASNEVRWIDVLTFIALTLAFPVIGGICMSKGINCIHNKRILRRAIKSRDKHKKELYRIKKEDLKLAREEEKKMEVQLKFLESPDFHSTFADDAFGGYLRGFAAGVAQSIEGIGTDYFDLAKQYRAKLAKRKIYESLASNSNGKAKEVVRLSDEDSITNN